MRKSGVPFRLRHLLLLLVVVLYMGVTGFSPSVMRAGVMWMLVYLAGMLREQTDSLTSLFLAGAVLCIGSPQAIFDIGFLLSMAAALGLIVLMEPLNKWLHEIRVFRSIPMRPIRALITLTATTLAASAFTAPITLFVFGEMSVVAPIANLILHIPVVVLMYCVPVLLLLSLFGKWLPVGFLLRFLSGSIAGDTALITDIAGILSKIEHVIVGVRYWFTAVLLFVFIVVLLTLMIRRRGILFVYPAYGAFVLSLLIAVQIHAFAVRGDAVLSYSVNGKNDNVTVVTDGSGMIIDASDGSWKNMRKAWEQLSEQNITELDACVLTHYHTRQTSMMQSLLENTVVRTILLPVPITEDEAAVADQLMSIAASAGTQIQQYRRGDDEIHFGNAVLSLLPYKNLSRSTQPLLGWNLTANGEDIVYLGGAAFEAEDGGSFSDKRDQMLGDSEILILGIHGPLYKEPLPPLAERAPTLHTVVAANKEVCAYLGDASESLPLYVAETDGMIRIILKCD